MSVKLSVNPSRLVSIHDTKITTTSITIAEAFSKEHRNVTQAIKKIDCSEGFRSANFSAYPYQHPQNKQTYTAYEITKDGFMFLVMGFTGKRAAAWKEAFINAFNEMAEKLKIDEQAQIAMLTKKVYALQNQDTLTPDQQRHIQETVNKIWSRDGIHFQTTYTRIKTEFRVGTYKDIKSKHYPMLCKFLGVSPRFSEDDVLDTGMALSKDQIDEINARLSSVMRIFHPFSDQFINLQSVGRILLGRNPSTGTKINNLV